MPTRHSAKVLIRARTPSIIRHVSAIATASAIVMNVAEGKPGAKDAMLSGGGSKKAGGAVASQLTVGDNHVSRKRPQITRNIPSPPGSIRALAATWVQNHSLARFIQPVQPLDSGRLAENAPSWNFDSDFFDRHPQHRRCRPCVAQMGAEPRACL